MGIAARNFGNGDTNIVTNAMVVGTANQGIFYDGSTANATITANKSVMGGLDGIYAGHSGTGNITVNVNDMVMGTANEGIDVRNAIGGAAIINLNSGADVSGATFAIYNDGGDSTTNAISGSKITGKVKLGDGSDTLNLSGSDFSCVTLLDGGDDVATGDGWIDTLSKHFWHLECGRDELGAAER